MRVVSRSRPGQRRGLPRGLSLFLGVAGIATASLLFSGCQDILNAMLDSAAPTGLSASDGDYPDRIQVSWGAPSLSGDKWKDYQIAGYNITWASTGSITGSVPESGSAIVSGTGHTIPVTASNRPDLYSVTVETRLRLGSVTSSGGFSSDTGFAIETEPLVWYDGGRDYTMASTDRWYVTMLQKGFTYSFVFPSATATVEFYKHKTLDLIHASGLSNNPSWVCDGDGAGHKFYVRIQTSSPTFRAGYGF